MSLTTGEVDDRGVALIQLDRPKAMNAINTEMLVELIEHVAVARGDEGVKVLVFSSTDYMAFSAGADIKEDIDDEAKVNKMQLFADLYDAVVQFPKPTIAACHGYVVGAERRSRPPVTSGSAASNLQMRFPGRRWGASRPGPAGHPLRAQPR